MVNPKLIPLLNLTEVQTRSYNWFLGEGIRGVLEEINPIRDYTGRQWRLCFENPQILGPEHRWREAQSRGLTYSAPWYLTARLEDEKKGGQRKENIFMGGLPLMTPLGTFIVNGVERVVVNQLRRSEGVFFTSRTDPRSGKILGGAKILPKVGAWLELETSPKDILLVRINQRRKMPVTTLLRLFGLDTDQTLRAAFAEVDTDTRRRFLETTLAKDGAKNRATAQLEIYRHMRPGEPATRENAAALVERLLFDPRRYNLGKVGRFKLNQRLGLNLPEEAEFFRLTRQDLVEIVHRIIKINHGLEEGDDVDHLANRRIRSVGELAAWELRVGLLQMERNIKRRMSLQRRDKLCRPGLLISPRPVQARLHTFFASSRLSQFKDQQNPLSELDHLRRLSVSGPGGITSERASFSVRDAHFSHYGRICPVRTPEGQSIGLVTYLALFARVNDYGFLETPYRRVRKHSNGQVKVTDEIEYLTAYDEGGFHITDASVTLDKNGFIREKRVPMRYQGEFFIGGVDEVDFIDVAPFQPVGASASLIPFLANDESYRSLVASNQQPQAVPLVSPQAPIVGTGMEGLVAEQSGRLIRAEEAGEIVGADAGTVVVKNVKGQKKEYTLDKFVRSNQYTCVNQKVVVDPGQKVKKGDLLADGPATENGLLALGTNLLVAYMSWSGLNFEDAVVVSERVVNEDLLTSIHINEHEVEVMETKLGPEEVTRDVPNVSEELLRNLDETGIVAVGSQVKAGDILVGKIAPKGETEITAEERLLRAVFGEKARDVRDNSLRLPHGESGTIIGVQVLTREENDELKPGVLKVIKVLAAQIRKIMVGDKLAGRHGNKGVIARVVPLEDMPHLEDGTPVDIILSPTSILNRMNLGQVLETHLGWAGQALGKKYNVPCFEKFLTGQITEELVKAGLPPAGKTTLIDGRTGESFDQKITVGQTYVLKLTHLAEDKIHARAIGPYTLITQQPVGGKSQFGGQRFGEMEVWALEAYGAAHTLQEMLTIKSDDVLGRRRAYESILRSEDIPEAKVPASFRLLVRELNGLCLNVETVKRENERAGG